MIDVQNVKNELKIFFWKIRSKYNYWRCKRAFRKYWYETMPHYRLTDDQIKILDDREKEFESKLKVDLLEYFNR